MVERITGKNGALNLILLVRHQSNYPIVWVAERQPLEGCNAAFWQMMLEVGFGPFLTIYSTLPLKLCKILNCALLPLDLTAKNSRKPPIIPIAVAPPVQCPILAPTA